MEPGTTELAGPSPAVAALLGALQGLTEFLPISSSGHLGLAQAWLGIDPAAGGHSFTVAVHAATLVAVMLAYRADLGVLVRALVRPGTAPEQVALVRALVLGTLPLGIALVPAVKDVVIAVEGRVPWIGAHLLVTALLLGLTVLRRGRGDEVDEAPIRTGVALAVGLCQLVAILPGISRSGATIAAGLVLGLKPEKAARFSFLLMIPAVLGASVKELADTAGSSSAITIDPVALVVGFVTSLVVGLAALGWLLRVLERGRLAWFVPYLVVVGLTAIVLG
jgi:undecaprenyl-diphosphatase